MKPSTIRPIGISLQCGTLFSLLAAVTFAADRPSRPIPPGDNPRERFLHLIDRPRVPLNATEQSSTSEERSVSEFAFDSESGQRVPGLIVSRKSDDERRPVVIAMHGTGGNKESLRPLLDRLADRGFLDVAIDGRYAAARSGGAKGAEAYYAALLETWK